MKTPTTPYSIEVQKKTQITRAFLESEGWILLEEKPLYESFEHSKQKDLRCSIDLYGSFSIAQLHWLNRTPEREFSTNNPELTKEDYRTVIRLLRIEV